MIVGPVQRKRLAVFPSSRYESERRLLSALGELYPVDFFRGDEMGQQRIDAAIFFPEAWLLSERVFERGISSFRFAPHEQAIPFPAHATVKCSNHPALHSAFCGAEEPLGGDSLVASQTPDNSEVVLIQCGSAPLWRFRKEDRGELHTSTSAPPELRNGQLLHSLFRLENWVSLFPLLQFLRSATTGADWQPAPPLGCFIFDDPNLHAARYGYLNFAQLARESREHNYHIAFATVPLDAVYSAPKAVELFRANRERLSLLIHGNSHVKSELVREYSGDQALRMLAQALRRVYRFERKTGLSVAKVMAPPHWGCSASVLAQLAHLPFDGLCVSIGSIAAHHDARTLPLDFGLSPSCILADGCPVVGRSKLLYGLLPLRFAAFLGQPIVPYGHHWDCADGAEQLTRVADTVNGWGPRIWTGMETIFRSQYRIKREGELLHVEMRSRRVRVRIPEGVSSVLVHIPSDADREMLRLQASSDFATARAHGWGVPIPVSPPSTLELSVLPEPLADPAKVRRPSYQPWAPVRRAMAIARDQLAPVFQAPPPQGTRSPAVWATGVVLRSLRRRFNGGNYETR